MVSAERAAQLGRWGSVLVRFFGSHAVVQVGGLMAGLLLVNFLPLREFALYTLATSILVFLLFLTDLGTSSALAHFQREAQLSGRSPSRHVAAVRSLRRWALAIVGSVGVAIFLVLAIREGYSWPSSLLGAAAIALTLVFQVEATLALLELRLRNLYGATYRAEIAGAVTRLAATVLLIVLGWLYGWLALAIGALAGLATLLLLAGHRETLDEPDLAQERRSVFRYLIPTLPSALYFSIQGPLVVWLAATFGSTNSLAEVGALGRLGLIVGALGGLVGVVFIPKLAQITDEKHWRRRYWQFGLLLFLLSIPVILLSHWTPEALLFLLGRNYAKLGPELLIVVATACLGLLDGYLVGVNNARSWTRFQAPALIVLVVAQAALAASIPLSTTRGVVLFGFWSRAVSTLCQLLIGVLGISRPRWVRWATA